jgi:hypothetical protein
MSQHERHRRRLRQLSERDPAPLLYPCTLADVARRRLPPDVLALTTEAVCSCCNVAVVAHTPVFLGMQELARRVDRELAILCGSCGVALARGGPQVELLFIDPQLAARLDQWETLKN